MAFLLASILSAGGNNQLSGLDHSESPDKHYDIVLVSSPDDSNGEFETIAVHTIGTDRVSGEEEVADPSSFDNADSILWKRDSRAVALLVFPGKGSSSCYVVAKGKAGWMDVSGPIHDAVSKLSGKYEGWISHSHDHLTPIKWMKDDRLELEWEPDYRRDQPGSAAENAPTQLLFFKLSHKGGHPSLIFIKSELETSQ